MAKEYVTAQELYRRLGISVTAGRKAEKAGRLKSELVKGRWLYDFSKNKRMFLSSSRDPMQHTPDKVRSRNLKRNNVKSKRKSDSVVVQEEDDLDESGNHPIDLIEDPVDTDGDFTQGMTKVQAESVKQVYLAKRAKVAFLKEVGVLVEQAVIKEEWEDLAVKTQKSVLAVPDRVAELFAASTDSKWIHAELTKELRYALSNIENYELKVEGADVNIEEISKE